MKLITALLSLFGIAVLATCKHKPSYKSAKNNNSLLWEISGNGLKNPSYFLGTMHLMCAEDAVLSNTTKSIIKKVGKVYLEVDLDNAGELLAGALNMADINSNNLKDVLPEEDYFKLKAFFEKYQPSLPFSIIEKQHPIIITSSLYEMFLSCDKKNGVEVLIVNESYKHKKDILGLETIEFQLSVFDKIPFNEQAFELVKTIDSIDKHKLLLEEMLQMYKQQDIDALYQLATKEEAGSSNFLDILLHNRNTNWVKQFDTIANNQPTLFAVGAGHLGGNKGVINQLKLKGYKLRPLHNN